MRPSLQTLLLLPLLTGGCMTHKLWTASPLDEWNEPASSPNLRLFRAERQDDFLVAYDEFSERRETTRPRMYFLNPNQKLLAQHDRPHFVKVNSADNLVPMPMFSFAPTNSTEKCYAVTATNSASFDIFFGHQKISSNQLPTYKDGFGQWKRVALTPVAVVADLTIVGAVAGCLWMEAGGPGLGGSR